MATDYRKKMVESAKKYLGTTAPKGDDQFIAAYNKWTKANFALDGTPWCAIFITYNARMVGVPTTVIPNFASCRVAIDWFKQRGRFHMKAENYVPKPGDLIFYDWNIDKVADHVGMVTSTASGKVNTTEGNTKKNGVYGVWDKSYSLSSNLIYGYAEPDYDGTKTAAVSNQTQLSTMVKPTYTKQFQEWMNKNYGQKLTVDGSFATNSRKAAISCWQKQMNTSFKSGLTVDGIFGTACQAAASKHVISQKSKSANLIYILQGLLYAHGYDPKGFDGIFGTGCLAAVKSFQKARSLTVDGQVGKNTWTSLFNKW